MVKNIKLSAEHGLNPSINVCLFCGTEKNELILPGRLKGDKKAPMKAVWDTQPCDTCRTHMKRGIMLICVDPEKTTNRKNPYRTGAMVVVTEEYVQRILDEDTAKNLIKCRMSFVPQDVWVQLGLDKAQEAIAKPADGTH
jgi:hypothetical protein